MSEPFSQTDTADREKKRETALRVLVRAYKRIDPLVIADLKQRFGFDRCEAESELLTDNQIARRSCMKMPLYHLLKMRAHTFRKDAKPKKALFGPHHETTNQPPI